MGGICRQLREKEGRDKSSTVNRYRLARCRIGNRGRSSAEHMAPKCSSPDLIASRFSPPPRPPEGFQCLSLTTGKRSTLSGNGTCTMLAEAHLLATKFPTLFFVQCPDDNVNVSYFPQLLPLASEGNGVMGSLTSTDQCHQHQVVI